MNTGLNPQGNRLLLKILLAFLLLIGGCSCIDYKVFRAKYPERSIWIWIWSGSR